MDDKPIDFEIIYDPITEACLNGLQIDASRHRILPDGDYILWMRRHYKRPSLFEYEHLETGNIVLADWIYPPRFAQELDCYPINERPNQTYLDYRMVSADVTAERAKKRLRDMADFKRQVAEARHETRKSAADRYKKMGLDREAKKMAAGGYSITSEFEDPDGHGQIREDLSRIARGRIITHG